MAENKLFLSAYYYSFDATGVREIDLILQAVAKAGKGYHNTEDWMDGGVVEPIQQAAKEAAAAWNRRTPPSTAGWLPISTGHASAIKVIERHRDEYIRDHCQCFNDGHYVGTRAQNEYIAYLDDIIDLLSREQPTPSQEGASEGEGSPAEDSGPV